MNFPAELKYTKEHEWIKVEGDVATIGITDFAQSELGDIVFMDVNSVGKEIAKDEMAYCLARQGGYITDEMHAMTPAEFKLFVKQNKLGALRRPDII